MMSFEVKEKDLLARIGKLRTRSGTVETPLFFPVVNPATQPISPRRILEEFGFDALITNAYILRKHFQNQMAGEELHKFLDFKGVIMTDSGAYQILVYGDIEVTSDEIVGYQEQIGTDIATILDIPTGWDCSENHAEQTVKETIRRAKELFALKTRDDILWVGPVQGGRYLNLVAKSAREMGKLPFQIHALGSPTEVMRRYRFDVLVDMLTTAKMNLPVERPLHLFGAGHPFMLALAVALGCDLFDSAAYAIYARENRYMTENGTFRLHELEHFPCACPKCTRATTEQVQELPQEERQTFLAEHNLYVCNAELKRIKQAIREGRLWEHLEMRAHSHPALLGALRKLRQKQDFIERYSPATKDSGLFFFSSVGLMRPEIVRYRKTLAEDYAKPEEAKILLLMPQTQRKPFHNSRRFRAIDSMLRQGTREYDKNIHTCFYAAPFGVIPIELDEVYPLSQHEAALPLDKETIEYVASQVADYISKMDYKMILLLNDEATWGKAILKMTKRACSKKDIQFKYLNLNDNENLDKPTQITVEILHKALSRQAC